MRLHLFFLAALRERTVSSMLAGIPPVDDKMFMVGPAKNAMLILDM
jgi:hypothetical protein